MSCFGSDRTVGVLCQRPSKGQVVVHELSGFSQLQNAVLRSHFKTEDEQNKRCRNGGQVEFRADFSRVVLRYRKAKLLPDLGIHPCIVHSPPLSLPPLSSHSTFHPSNLSFITSDFSQSLSSFSGDC